MEGTLQYLNDLKGTWRPLDAWNAIIATLPGTRIVVRGVYETEWGEGALFLRRSNRCKSFRGCWEFPGGKHEASHLVVETLDREITEESRITFTEFSSRLYGVFESETRDSDNRLPPMLTLAVRISLRRCLASDPGTPRVSDEHDAAAWVPYHRALTEYQLTPSCTHIAYEMLRQSMATRFARFVTTQLRYFGKRRWLTRDWILRRIRTCVEHYDASARNVTSLAVAWTRVHEEMEEIRQQGGGFTHRAFLAYCRTGDLPRSNEGRQRWMAERVRRYRELAREAQMLDRRSRAAGLRWISVTLAELTVVPDWERLVSRNLSPRPRSSRGT